MSDTFSNFPSWWIEYSKDKTGAEWEIGSAIWMACFAAWNYAEHRQVQQLAEARAEIERLRDLEQSAMEHRQC